MTAYEANTNGTCPHCGRAVQFTYAPKLIIPTSRGNAAYDSYIAGANWGKDDENYVFAIVSHCPSCNKPIIEINIVEDGRHSSRLAHPFTSNRKAPPEVPPSIKKDFDESVLVLPLSENASAALSRRCLEKMLTDKGHCQHKLSDKVKDALSGLPSDLSFQLDAVREVGNFGAHPIKDETSGTIVDVEPGEAEFILGVLEQLFDYYYVRPKKSRQAIDNMNEKLAKMGRKPLQGMQS